MTEIIPRIAYMDTPVAWDDLRFPAGGLNPPGPVAAPAVDPDTGLLVFADAATNLTGSLAQMPHSWLEGSEVRPHVHWIQPAAGDVVWRLEYRLLPAVDGPFPAEWTAVTASATTHSYPGSGNQVMITPFPAIDMTGFTLSAMILFRLARLGGDVADTVAADVQLLEFDIHYQLNSRGSTAEFVKRG